MKNVTTSILFLLLSVSTYASPTITADGFDITVSDGTASYEIFQVMTFHPSPLVQVTNGTATFQSGQWSISCDGNQAATRQCHFHLPFDGKGLASVAGLDDLLFTGIRDYAIAYGASDRYVMGGRYTPDPYCAGKSRCVDQRIDGVSLTDLSGFFPYLQCSPGWCAFSFNQKLSDTEAQAVYQQMLTDPWGSGPALEKQITALGLVMDGVPQVYKVFNSNNPPSPVDKSAEIEVWFKSSTVGGEWALAEDLENNGEADDGYHFSTYSDGDGPVSGGILPYPTISP